MKNFSLILFALCCLMMSCHSTKKIQTGASQIGNEFDSTATDSALAAAHKLVSANEHFSFNTLSAKIKVDYEDIDGKQPEVNAFIRMKKDEAIWLSIAATFLNIEAARVLITPDSFIIINKLEKTIEAHPVSFLQEKISLPVTFNDIQKLVAGKIILSGDSISGVSSSQNFIQISSILPGVLNRIFFTLPDLLLAKQSLQISQGFANYSAEVLYEDYEKNGDNYFSTFRDVSIPSKNQRIKLTFKQYEFNKELSLPFNRPEGYTIK